MTNYEKLAEGVIEGLKDEVKELIQQMLDAGENPLDIIKNGLLAGMAVVGVRFKAGDMYMPEVLLCAKLMNECTAMLKPYLQETDIPSAGTVIIGTVKNDLHDIGKNLVRIMLESSGFTVIDIGIDVPNEKFIEAVKEHKPSVLGLCALLTTTMPYLGEVIENFKKAGLRDQVKILVGGAPVTAEFAQSIGADGYAQDAPSAVDFCKQYN